MQGLRPAQHGGQRLNRRAYHVNLRLLRGERRAGRLRVKPQHQRTRVAGVKTIAHDPGPETPRRAKLGNLFQKIVVRVEEERDAGRKFIDLEPGVDRSFDVSDGIGDGKSHFLDCGRTGFANVIAAD